jgi:hypothetical protein
LNLISGNINGERSLTPHLGVGAVIGDVLGLKESHCGPLSALPGGKDLMAQNSLLDRSTVTLDPFHELVADLREALRDLQEIETGMTDTLTRMKAEGQSRERLLVAEAMLKDLRAILREGTSYV